MSSIGSAMVMTLRLRRVLMGVVQCTRAHNVLLGHSWFGPVSSKQG